jgi:hypothetical protein
MYINVKKHILSGSLLQVAVIKIVAALLEGSIRTLLEKASSQTPDMLDITLWRIELAISLIQIAATALVFYFNWKKLNHYMMLVPKDDQKGMAELQKEFLGEKNIASLSVSSVSRLLQLWAVIFIGAELIYVFTSIMYRRFIAMLMDALSFGAMTDGTFVMLYNMTHGFKYLEILAAILLGVVMTGIFLNDRYLKLASLVILTLFLISFAVMQMQTVYLMGREVGIVWTSIIYHLTETLGIIFLSGYLNIRYKGL